jgi:hypothetical protein
MIVRKAFFLSKMIFSKWEERIKRFLNVNANVEKNPHWVYGPT